MAKNSFLLGTTRGSVGNIVVRRSNGQTIISAKPASVSNPRTYAQAENRMRLSAVSKFYSPLAQVLEQGVQGKNTLDSQAEFSSYNIRIMREQGLGWPKEADFGPMPFRLTKGSVPSVGAKVSMSSSSGASSDNSFIIPYPLIEQGNTNSVGYFARYLQGILGLSVSRFQVTFVCVVGRVIVEERTEVYEPRAFRIEADTASNTPLSSVLPAWITTPSGEAVVGDTDLPFLVSGHLLGCAVIISYYDGRKWVRSTEYMNVWGPWLDTIRSYYEQYVATYMDSAAVTDPDGRVYLDGFTRRSSGGGGGGEGYDYDPSVFTLHKGSGSSAPAITQKAVAVVPVSLDGTQVVGLLLDDDSTAVLTGNMQLNTYGKAFNFATQAQITLTSEQQATVVWPARQSVTDGDYFDFYAWVADQLGWPITSLIYART